MPDLNELYPGDALNLSSYPNLKSVIQTGHTNIRGVNKFKDHLFYAQPQSTSFELPQNNSSDLLFECYQGGKKIASHSNGEIADKSTELWSDHFSSTAGDIPDGKMFNYENVSGDTARPVFMSCDLETPLGFASFLANASNHRKVFIPATFNMSKILKSVSR